MIKALTDFLIMKSADSGGKTGSFCGTLKTSPNKSDPDIGKLFQLKPPVSYSSFKRQIKANRTDRENYGEFIAAAFARILLDNSVIPEISLVYDSHNKKVWIASKYFENQHKDAVKDLDHYIQETLAIPIPKGKRNIVFSRNDNRKTGKININNTKIKNFKQDLANALVISAIIGDHDINTGNLVVIDQNKLARIDFGHAFNDLLHTHQIHGGKVRDTNNPIFDFFNRSSVAGILGAPSKFWRYYPELLPSQEIVNALKTIGHLTPEKKTMLLLCVENTKTEFKSLINCMKQHKDNKGIQHLIYSVNEITQYITGKPVKSAQTADSAVAGLIDAIHRFILKNCKNALVAAEIMQCQIEIDKLIHSNKINKTLLNTTYAGLKQNSTGNIQWIKLEKNTPAFNGSLSEYIDHRIHMIYRQKIPKLSHREHLVNFFFNTIKPPQANRVVKLSELTKNMLKNKLHYYLIVRALEPKKNSFFGRYDQNAKIAAARAVLDILNNPAKKVDINIFESHKKALRDGRLGQLIIETIQTQDKSLALNDFLDTIGKSNTETAGVIKTTGKTQNNLSF